MRDSPPIYLRTNPTDTKPPTPPQQQTNNSLQLQMQPQQLLDKAAASQKHAAHTKWQLTRTHTLCRESNFLYTGKSDLDASSQKLPTSGAACTRKHEEEPPEQDPPQPCTQVTATQIPAKNQKFNDSKYLLRWHQVPPRHSEQRRQQCSQSPAEVEKL